MADNPRIEELRRRVQADPASIAFAALAEEYRRAGRYEEAIETCRTGLQRHPSYLSARVTLGRSLVEVRQYDEACKELDLVLKAAPENLAAIRALAEIHERRGETPEALEQYKTALSLAQQEAVADPPSSAPAVSAPAADAALMDWVLPKQHQAPAVAVTLERITIAAVQEQPQSTPDGQLLEDLERFLASIEAARRSGSSERPGVAAR